MDAPEPPTGSEATVTEPAPGPATLPERIVVIATGSINVAALPWWIGWARETLTRTRLRIVLTRSATRFVSQDALAVISGSPVAIDVWPEHFTAAPHMELAAWADAFLVYPATAHYVTRLGLGLSDTPSLLALLSSTAPVVVAPALPEGVLESAAMQRSLKAITETGRMRILTPVPGRSWSTGRHDAAVPPPFPQALRLLARQPEPGTADHPAP